MSVSERGTQMNERMKQVREALGLSQAVFGEGANVGLGTIKNIDYNKTEPNPLYFDLLCKAYNVNSEWLETGQGEMFRDLSREEKIAAFVGEALADETDSFKRDLISLLASLDEAGWQTLRDAAKVIVDAVQKQKEEE